MRAILTANATTTMLLCARLNSPRARRPTAEQREKVLRPRDVANLIHYVASAPDYVRFDEVVITPMK